MQLDNPKHELFAQALIKNKGHQTMAYKEIYPNSSSARFCASRLLANVAIQRRISEILEEQKLGLKEIIEYLKRFLEGSKITDRNGNVISYSFNKPELRLEVLRILLRLHGYLGNEAQLTPEQISSLLQMVKEQEILTGEK